MKIAVSAMWTLWLITQGTTGASPVVAPLATYADQTECYQSMAQLQSFWKKAYTPPADPGLVFCLAGAPPKR